MGFFSSRAMMRKLNEVEINGQKAGADDEDEQKEEDTNGTIDDDEANEGDGEISEPDGDTPEDVPEATPATDDVGEEPTTGEDTGGEGTPPEGGEEVPAEGDEDAEVEIQEPADDVATDDDYDIPDDDTTGAGELGDETGTDGEIGDDDTVEGQDNDDIGTDSGTDTDGEIGDEDGEIGDGGATDGTIGDTGDTVDGGGSDGETDIGDTGGEIGGDEGTIDDGGDTGEVGDDEGGEIEGDGTDDGGEGSGSINDDIKNIENNILADLTGEQKKIQSDELRQNFVNMYNTTVEVIEKVNNLQKDEESLSVFEFMSSQLLILKDILNMTITKTFNTKSYFENMNTYQYCLAILSKVDELIKEIEKKHKKDEEE